MKPFDASGAFHPSAQGGEVRRLAVRGAGVTVLSGGAGLAAQVFGTVALARLLTPADFGVVAMVTTVSLLLVNFGMNGFTEAVIQREKIDRYLASNIFWVNLGGSFLLTIGFAASGSLLARFFHYPLVARVAVSISVTIFITGISVQHLALLKRAMCFSATSANEVISRVLSLAVSIYLAWAGWGYRALIAGAIAQTVVQAVGAWYLCRWIPSFPRRVAGTSAMIRFAANVYARFALGYFTRNTDNLLVGWRFGAIPLGFYKKAYDLFALSTGQLTAPLTNVAVSALSRFSPRSNQYRQHLLSAFSVVAFVGMGISGVLTLAGKDLIQVLLGPKWAPAGSVFTFFAPGIGAMLIYYMHGWIHLSIGKADRWLRWGFIEVTVTILLFLLAMPWGPVGIAFAWTLSFWSLSIPALWYAGRPIAFGIAPVLAAVWKHVVASFLAVCATAGISHGITPSLPVPESAAARLLITSVVFGALYLGAEVLFHWGWEPLNQVARLVKEVISLRQMLALSPSMAISPETHRPPASLSREARLKPLVSILIPAFNAQEWIADTLRSAIVQTWERKEIIVVDDGSIDQTLTIAQQFASDSVRIYTQKNQGAAAARNKAFSLSKGDYIQWLDADDLLAPDKIARQIAVLEQCENRRMLLSSGYGRFLYRSDQAQFCPTALWCDLSRTEWLIRKLGQNIFMQTATWLVSRELSEAAGPWDTMLLGDDDGEYFCRVLLASDGVRFVPGARSYYRAPFPNTLSYIGRSNRKLDALWRSMQLHIKYLRSMEDSERVRAACLRYLQTGYINFYPEKSHIVRQMEQMASELGGQLETPRLPWKYSWIAAALGLSLAKRVQTILLTIKWGSDKLWDKMLFRLRNQFSSTGISGRGNALEFETKRTADELISGQPQYHQQDE